MCVKVFQIMSGHAKIGFKICLTQKEDREAFFKALNAAFYGRSFKRRQNIKRRPRNIWCHTWLERGEFRDIGTASQMFVHFFLSS